MPVIEGLLVALILLLCALSCMNSGARILYPKGRPGVFHRTIGNSHEENETPHVAVTLVAILIFRSATILTMVFKLEILDAFNDAGTFGAFGFPGAYFLISLAAQAYLKRAGILTWTR